VFRIDEDFDTAGGARLPSDEDRAEALRDVFAELAGLSAHKAAAELDARGVATPDGRSLVGQDGLAGAQPAVTHLSDRSTGVCIYARAPHGVAVDPIGGLFGVPPSSPPGSRFVRAASGVRTPGRAHLLPTGGGGPSGARVGATHSVHPPKRFGGGVCVYAASSKSSCASVGITERAYRL
jgi:hypothetical protein